MIAIDRLYEGGLSRFLAILEEWQRARSASICYALAGLSEGLGDQLELEMGPSLRFALLHHTLFEVRRAYRDDDAALARQAFEIWSPDLWQGGALKNIAGPIPLCVDHTLCRPIPLEDGMDEAAYTLTPEAIHAGFQTLTDDFLRQTKEYLQLVNAESFASLTSAVVIHLKYRTMDDSLSGFTLSPFPLTMYADWTDSPIRYAENVLHEAGHSALNMIFAQDRVSTGSTQRRWFSPWREMDRPASGIVHGAFAFSLVHYFYRNLADSNGFGLLDARQLAYCRDRAEFEFSRLMAVKQALPEALAELRSQTVQKIVLATYPC